MLFKIYENPIRISRPTFLSITTIKYPLKYSCNYNIKKGIIIFQKDDTTYVIPNFHYAEKILNAGGFIFNPQMPIIFRGNDYPVDHASEWNNAKSYAEKINLENIVDYFKSYSHNRNIRKIPNKDIVNCLEIPKNGICVRYLECQTIYYPIKSNSLPEKIGAYFENKGVCVFIHYDGKTYITKNSRVIEMLPEFGYRKEPLLVPLSNGEYILDSNLREIWEKLKV